MGVKVISVGWDKFLGKLRVHGTICHAPDIVPTGAHHTISVALNQPVTIVKKDWPKHLLDRIIKASESEKPLLIISSMMKGSLLLKLNSMVWKSGLKNECAFLGNMKLINAWKQQKPTSKER
jgi:stalled ribosome rescue protein Dom34